MVRIVLLESALLWALFQMRSYGVDHQCAAYWSGLLAELAFTFGLWHVMNRDRNTHGLSLRSM